MFWEFYSKPNENNDLNLAYIFLNFRDEPVYDISDAKKRASNLDESLQTEYGVMVETINLSWKDIENEAIKIASEELDYIFLHPELFYSNLITEEYIKLTSGNKHESDKV